MRTFTPKFLPRWTLPRCYVGAHWQEYFSFLGRSRDSDALERANFDAGLKAIGGEQSDRRRDDPQNPGCALPLVLIVRESHWAVGWVEWIAIHETATEALETADKLKSKLENYPVVDEELLSQYETDEANETWRNCFRPGERVAYIRAHRNQFYFCDFEELLGCVRGKYFTGYASELLH